MMRAIRRHYDRVRAELRTDGRRPQVLPSRVHAIVLVSTVHKPTLRALAYARATRRTHWPPSPSTSTTPTPQLQAEWEDHNIQVPLKVIDSPYREITSPSSTTSGRTPKSPRDVVAVFIPEYVVGRWWENLLHNQSALRLKGRLLFEPGVMVTSVPWQLRSSEHRDLARVVHTPAKSAAASTVPSRRNKTTDTNQAGGRGEHRPGG